MLRQLVQLQARPLGKLDTWDAWRLDILDPEASEDSEQPCGREGAHACPSLGCYNVRRFRLWNFWGFWMSKNAEASVVASQRTSKGIAP